MTSTLTRLMITKPFLLKVTFWATITVLALVLGACTEGGMYQGGGDDTPRWR